MAINEEQRQLEIAAEVEELARALAHSTRDVPHPRDSYRQRCNALLSEVRFELMKRGHVAQGGGCAQ